MLIMPNNNNGDILCTFKFFDTRLPHLYIPPVTVTYVVLNSRPYLEQCHVTRVHSKEHRGRHCCLRTVRTSSISSMFTL